MSTRKAVPERPVGSEDKERGLTVMERQAISGAGTSCPGSCPLQAMQRGLGQRPGNGSRDKSLVGCQGNALTPRRAYRSVKCCYRYVWYAISAYALWLKNGSRHQLPPA